MSCSKPICKYFLKDCCLFGNDCRNLHPPSILLTRLSQEENREMLSKTCGICYEVIMEKPYKYRTFGILPNCSHCYCFYCLQQWRRTSDFPLPVTLGCPECRTISDFVYSSRNWYENEEKKAAFIGFKNVQMKEIECRFFRRGEGICYLGEDCHFSHALLPREQGVAQQEPLPPIQRERNQVGDNLVNLPMGYYYYLPIHIMITIHWPIVVLF
ncbi:unnamed protein product [Ceutorhynchus assimilis]|uniref:RING-type E3 ubiquitin transferase n=1 Tax=Ceutorhynchus assimilis TaxID=467358 RepID=A0A9N9QHY9_9CUCU|nr:unnamed protein product [Ceutorhynchus assimilis]